MSTSSKKQYNITLADIKQAILVNTCRPTESEGDHFTMTRFIRCSQNLEGNSQLGIILFIGVAKQYNFSEGSIQIYSSIEREQLAFKFTEFKERLKKGQIKIGLMRKSKKNVRYTFWDEFDDNVRFAFKVQLVKNYLKLKQRGLV